MASFSSSDISKMRQWTEGSKDYITKVSIVARWSTKIPGTSYSTDTGLSPIADPEADLNILETGQESEEQEVQDIFDVRFKVGGLTHDMKFRAASLNFVWPNYAQFKQGKSERAIRFYLKISLVDSSANELILLKTDWFKIKSTEEVYSTSRSSGADVKIEAIPWIYEYNEPTMEGNDARAWLEGGTIVQSSTFGFTFGGYNDAWFSSTEGTEATRTVTLRSCLTKGYSIVAIGRSNSGGLANRLGAFMSNGLVFDTGVVGRQRVTSWSYGQNVVNITFQDGSTDSFSTNISTSFRTDGGKWDRNGSNTGTGSSSFSGGYLNTPMSYRVSFNGLLRVQKLLHDRKRVEDYSSLQVTYKDDSPCSYTGPFVFFNGISRILFVSKEVVGAVSAILDMGPMRISGDCEETALSYLSWWALKEGAALRPRFYIKDERVLDTPLVEFYELGYRIQNDRLDYLSSGINDFSSIENSDEQVVFEDIYQYQIDRYYVAPKTYEYQLEGNTYTKWMASSIVVPFSYDYGNEKRSVKGWIEGKLDLEDDASYSNSSKGQQEWLASIHYSSTDIIMGEQFYGNLAWVDSSNFEAYIPYDWNIQGVDNGSFYYIYFSCIQYEESVGDVGTVVEIDTHGVMDIPRFSAGNFDSGLQRGDLLAQYASKTERVKFNAEWRPWIKIYSKLRVKAMNSFGADYWVSVMVTSIDANADSMSASYEGIVLEKEAA